MNGLKLNFSCSPMSNQEGEIADVCGHMVPLPQLKQARHNVVSVVQLFNGLTNPPIPKSLSEDYLICSISWCQKK